MTNKQNLAKTILKDIMVIIGLLGGQILCVLSDLRILEGDIFMWISLVLFVISHFVILFIQKNNLFDDAFRYNKGDIWLQKYACDYRLRLYIISALWIFYMYTFSRAYVEDSILPVLALLFQILIILIAIMEGVLIAARKRNELYDPMVSDSIDKQERKAYTILRIGYIFAGVIFFIALIVILCVFRDIGW